MKKLLLLPIIALAIVVFFNGCKKDEFEPKEFLCPLVISTIPVDNAIDVPLDQIISATFNMEMDSATINQESFIVLQGEASKAVPVPNNGIAVRSKGNKEAKSNTQESSGLQQASTLITGAVTYNGLTASFSPSVPLLPDVLYLATVTTKATDQIGQGLMEDYHWSFTTNAEITLSSIPEEGGTTSGAGTFIQDSLINVVATPNFGYSFVNWTQDGVVVSTNPDYHFTMDGNRDLVANFTLQHVVTLSSNPVEGGMTTGGGIYNLNASVTVSAIASAGYTFLNWTEGTNVVSQDANYNFTITGNRELVANFTENGVLQFTVDLSSSPTEGGNTIGGGIFDLNALVNISASANAEYEFSNWTEGDIVVSQNANYTFMITENRTLVANFTKIVTTQYTVGLSSNPIIGGNTIGEGTFNSGTSVTVSAGANVGYQFLNWTEGTNVVSQNAQYTFTITDNRVLVANFTENVAAQYIVSLSSNPAEGGATLGGGAFELNASVTVLAQANVGYEFLNWTEGTNVVSANAAYSFTITENRTLVANFTEIVIEQFSVGLSSNPAEGGTTSGAGIFDSGASVTILANVNPGYTFLNWTEGANIVSQNAIFTFTITENRELVANFIDNSPVQYIVDLSSNPAEGGTTSGAGIYDSGESVTVSANANTGYTFLNWTEGTNIVSTNAAYTFTITDNRILVANFTEDGSVQYNVELSSNPAEGGTTSGAGTYDSGESVTISANANIGYIFLNWTEGANIVSTNAAYTFTITDNRILVANFTEDGSMQYNVELSSNPAEGGNTNGAGTYDEGASVTVSAIANVGYTFLNWSEGTNILSSNLEYTFIITGDRVLVANFEENDPIGPGQIDLGGAGFFSILTKSGISTTGVTAIEGNIGVSPATSTAITGFALIMNTDGASSHTTIPTLVTGNVYAADYAPPTPAMLTAAVSDMETAFTTANGLVVPAPIIDMGAGNISGLTLAPGLYKWSTGVLLDSDATVTLSGNENDTWVFQIAQDLALMASSQVILQGGAQASNITWVVTGQAVLGTETELFGNILSATLISLNTGATVTGRLLAQTAVTLNASTVVAP